MTLKISISGMRGTPEALTKEVCENFARAFASYLNNKGTVVVGCDTRPNSNDIKSYVLQALLELGINCLDAGICPTPTIGVYVREKKLSGGVMITASHNPLPWNGIKLMRHDGIFLNEKQARKLLSIYEKLKLSAEKKSAATAKGETATQSRPATKQKGKITVINDALNIHIYKLLDALNPAPIKARRFKVVVDPVNGAGFQLAPQFLKKLNCEVIMLHADPAKVFERPPEPTPTALAKLCEKVKSEKADIGFALDPDADRLALVDETGTPLSEELSVVIAADYVLGSRAGGSAQTARRKLFSGKQKVVVNLSTTMAMDDIAKRHRARLYRTKIGEVHVSEKMKKLHSPIGGEGNGGVIFPKVGFNRDAFSGILLILEYLAGARKKLSEVAGAIPKYYSVKEKVHVTTAKEAATLIKKAKTLFSGAKLDLIEGVKIIFPDGWLHVRASNTEPIVRVMGEGKELNKIKKWCREVKA
jgi:phosphomannomutase